MRILFAFLLCACGSPDPETGIAPVASDPETAAEAEVSDPETAAAPTQAPAADTAAPVASYSGVGVTETDAVVVEPVPSYAAKADVAEPEAQPVPCTLGDADRGDGPRVMHAECPDTAPYCQRHGVCGTNEYEAPECSRAGYDFEDIGDNVCRGLCNAYLVCEED